MSGGKSKWKIAYRDYYLAEYIYNLIKCIIKPNEFLDS